MRLLAMVALGALVLVGACGNDGPAAVSPPTLAPQPSDPSAPRRPLLDADQRSEELSGIGQLDGLGATCTAFLLDVGALDGPAYAMTSGRCVGISDNVTVLHDRSGAGGHVAFRRFVDTPQATVDVDVTSVRYATMRGTDVAVLELDATRQDLAELASYALGAPPADGERISVAGVPTTGLDPADWVLRGDTCTAGATVRLAEWDWLWDAGVATDCAGIIGGSSGSPVFAAGDLSSAVAIVNTTTIGAGPGARNCSLGQPCELSSTGTARRIDRTYAMPVQPWAACFDPAWDATAPGCPAERAPIVVAAPLRAVPPGATWNARLPGGSRIVLKAGPGGATDCRDPAGYAPAPTNGTYDAPLPTAEGVYVLCGAAIDDAGAPMTADAGAAVMEVDATPPATPIRLSQHTSDDGVTVEPIFSPPEHSSFDVKAGTRSSTDCADPTGYVIYRRVALHVTSAELPGRLCVIGEDEAGNRGDPQAFDLP